MSIRSYSCQIIILLCGLPVLLIAAGCGFPVQAGAALWTDHDYIQNATCLQADGAYMWVGSTAGVWRIKRADGTFVHYTTQNGLPNPVVMDIAMDESGTKWVATLGGAGRYDGSGWISFTTGEGLISNQVRALAIDSSGVIWFGTQVGVSRFDGDEWTAYTVTDGLAGNSVNGIAVDAAGSVWFATDNGVSRFNGKRWTTYTARTGLADNQVNAAAVADSGIIWFATGNGASRYAGNTWTTFRMDDGLGSNLVNDVAIDPDGQIWFGCYGGGVSGYSEDGWVRYTRVDGLISNQVTAVAVDEDGHKWFATAIGVSELNSASSLADTADTTSEDSDDEVVFDEDQDNVASMLLPDGEVLTVVSRPGTSIADLAIDDLPSASAVPSDLDFPYGLIDFTIEDVGAGKSTTVTMYFPDDAAPSTYYKYGPTPDQPQDHWYEFLYNGETGAKIDGNVVNLYFVDGKRGDDVYTLDGRIVDIGGPGFRNSSAGDSTAAGTAGGSGGGDSGAAGCFLSGIH